ncbi:MAG: DUF3857 domain-containing protein [Calditrichia bacterium]|nr:DUF3857 domain-containing protein [Calditrichia bacterium]
MKFKLLVVLMLGLFFISAFAEEKWGKVSKEILQQETFSEDPEAEAIILFDIGEMNIVLIDNMFWLEKKIHKRIKVITEDGKKHATVRIPFYYEDKIRGLEAQVFLPNGKKIKMKGKEVHEEESGKTRTKVFAIPGVEVGSVIEYKYTLKSDYLTNLEAWDFQDRIYTKLSRLTVYLPSGFSYNVFTTNVDGVEPDPVYEKIKDIQTRKWLGKYTWEFVELPAIKDEPYMKNWKDYKTSIHFQLISYKDQYQYYKFIKEWKDLAEKAGEGFNKYIKITGDIKKLTKNLIGTEFSGEKEQAEILYKYVRDSIKTDGRYRILKKVNKILKERNASAGAKNILLISLLRYAGFNANPVLISTRTNGKVYSQSPKLDQFNHIIVKVQVGKFSYCIDASDEYVPFGTLPANDLVNTGFEVKDKIGDFVKLISRKKTNIDRCEIKAKLTEDGELICETEITKLGYIGTSEKRRLEKKEASELWEERLKDTYADVVFDSVKVEGLEEDGTKVKTKLYYTIPDYAQVVGDNMYLPIPFLNKSESNIFKREKRSFPVDYDYPFTEIDKVEIELPGNISVIEAPPNVSQRINGASLISDINNGENTITVTNKFKIDKMTFSPKEYRVLRALYGKVVETDQGQIVLKIKSE